VILRVTRPHKRTKDVVVTKHVFDGPNGFSGRAPDLSVLPDLLAAIGAGVPLLRGRQGRGAEGEGEGEKEG